MTLEQFIRTSTWGRLLREDELAPLLSSAQQAQVGPREHVVRAGEVASHWMAVIDGVAVQQVCSGQGRVAGLIVGLPGTWFGEGTLMRRARWQYDVVARSEARVAMIPADDFMRLLGGSAAFAHYIADLLNDRLSHVMALLANERLTQAETRLARTLGAIFDPGLFPERAPVLDMGQRDIGQLAGMSRQRANAALKRLEATGLIELRGEGGVRVVDREGLMSYGVGSRH
jgi:CRP-like cAMP-binding protein